MHDSTMIKISLVLILIGLPLLALLSVRAIPEKDNTTLLSDQQVVTVDGIIKDVRISESITRANLQTCMNMPLVFFDNISLIEDKKVKIKAKKDSYQGRPQLVVDELEYV